MNVFVYNRINRIGKDVGDMRETRILEFKETITNTFLKTVSAFSNYDGGTIVFGIDDDGFCLILLQVVQLFSHQLCFLKTQFLCMLLHFLAEMLDHRVKVSFQEVSDLHQPIGIILLGLQAFTGPFAIAKVILQAYLVFSFFDISGCKIQFTGTEGNVLPDEFQQLPYFLDRGEWTEVF